MTPEMLEAQNALMSQWKRSKKLRSAEEVEKLAISKGLSFMKHFTLDADLYSVRSGDKRLARGSLEDVATFIDNYTAVSVVGPKA